MSSNIYRFEPGEVATACGKIYFCHQEKGICMVDHLTINTPYVVKVSLMPLEQRSLRVDNFKRINFGVFTVMGFSVEFDFVSSSPLLYASSHQQQVMIVRRPVQSSFENFWKTDVLDHEEELFDDESEDQNDGDQSTSQMDHWTPVYNRRPPVRNVSTAMLRGEKRRLEPTDPCRCNLCGKMFKNPKRLGRHMPVHSDDRPNTCDICLRSFKWKQDLDKHMRRLHKGIDTSMLPHDQEKPFVCDMCGYKGEFERALRIHQVLAKHVPPGGLPASPSKRKKRKKIGIVKESVKVKTNAQGCRDCGRVFRNQTSFSEHVAQHRPFKCDNCSLRFFSENDLNVHRKMHLSLDDTITNVVHTAAEFKQNILN